MAIYKPPKARWPLAVFAAVIGLLVGTAIGLLIGRDEPNAAEGVRLVQQELTAAAAGLEVAGIEYSESVEDGEVVNDTEYEGSLDAVESSRARYDRVASALAELAPERADAIESAYDEVVAAMGEHASPEDVGDSLDALADMLKGEA